MEPEAYPVLCRTEHHVLVETREGVFWRKKRRGGKLNGAFAENADLARLSGPAGRQVVQRLRPFLRGIDAGRLTLRISNALRKGLKEEKQMGFRILKGMDLQRDHPLHQLLLVPYELVKDGSGCRIRICAGKNCVKRQNRLASHFYFEALLLYGDPGIEHGLRTESVESKLYAFGEKAEEPCELCLSLPEDGSSWMVLLKVSCLEGNEMAVHPKHYGMKVVEVG